MKEMFVDKLNEFDFLIEDKEKKINTLDDSISKKEKKILELEEKIKKLNENKGEKASGAVALPKCADLEDGNLLISYKKIKDNFNYNARDVIDNLIKENNLNNKSSELYQKYKHIRDYFSFDIVYKISTYQSNKQFIIISELLNDDEKHLLKDLLKVEKFNIRKFVDELDRILIRFNPKIKVYVGDKKVNYNDINPNVETIYTDEITEGFKVEYKGVIYDYSI